MATHSSNPFDQSGQVVGQQVNVGGSADQKPGWWTVACPICGSTSVKMRETGSNDYGDGNMTSVVVTCLCLDGGHHFLVNMLEQGGRVYIKAVRDE